MVLYTNRTKIDKIQLKFIKFTQIELNDSVKYFQITVNSKLLAGNFTYMENRMRNNEFRSISNIFNWVTSILTTNN